MAASLVDPTPSGGTGQLIQPTTTHGKPVRDTAMATSLPSEWTNSTARRSGRSHEPRFAAAPPARCADDVHAAGLNASIAAWRINACGVTRRKRDWLRSLFPRRPSVAKQITSGFAVAGIDNPLFTPNQPHASVTPKSASRRHRLNSKPTRTPQAARADRAGHQGPDSREITISGRCRVRPFGLGHIADGGALPLQWRHPTLARSEALGVERIMTLGLRSCGPSSPHQLSASRPCIRRRALC